MERKIQTWDHGHFTLKMCMTLIDACFSDRVAHNPRNLTVRESCRSGVEKKLKRWSLTGLGFAGIFHR